MSSSPERSLPPSMSPLARWFAPVACLLALLPALAFWWWQGRAVAIADAPTPRLPCVSFAPFAGSQTPFDEALVLPPEQIERDLARLANLTNCVRTYSVDQGLDQVPAIAQRLGMKVLLGAWIGRERAKNEAQIARVVELANRYPDTVAAVIVGNEVLLRREQPASALAAMIGRVRQAVSVPVTYADVWEFWQKNPEVGEAVDFVTIHTLPYWEDDPIAIEDAVAHIGRIWQQMGREFPNKRIFIGEAGWPSAGRMREGALPSIVNQARFVREMMALAASHGIGLNLIESFDQPWKRRLEGTVGGHWGLLDARRQPKFALTGPVSDEPRWLLHFAIAAAAGLALLAPALLNARRLRAPAWLGLALGAAAAGSLLVLGIRDGLPGTRTIFDWIVFAARVATGGLAAMLVLEALARPAGAVRPLAMAALIDSLRRCRRPDASLRAVVLGAARAVALFGAAASTLCLIFDPRYRDFASALYALPALSFLTLAFASAQAKRTSGGGAADRREETLLATVLAVGGVIVVWREGLANHQALAWMAMALVFAGAIAVESVRSGAAYRRAMASAPSNAPPAAGSGP